MTTQQLPQASGHFTDSQNHGLSHGQTWCRTSPFTPSPRQRAITRRGSRAKLTRTKQPNSAKLHYNLWEAIRQPLPTRWGASFRDDVWWDHHFAALQTDTSGPFAHLGPVGPSALVGWGCVCMAGTAAALALSMQKHFQPVQLPNGHLIRTRFVSRVTYRPWSQGTLHGGTAKLQMDIREGLADTLACHRHRARYPDTTNDLCGCQLVKNEKANKHARLELCLHKFL